MRAVLIISLIVLLSCNQNNENKISDESIKKELLSLERKWLEAEFALDTAYLSTLLDSSFLGIAADHISDKQEELKGMYVNISAMRKDSIFLDSLRLEDAVVNIYDNTAVVTFIVHTYKKDRGNPVERRTRFYDVWINRNGNWKAISSQGTVIENNSSN